MLITKRRRMYMYTARRGERDDGVSRWYLSNDIHPIGQIDVVQF